MKVHKIKGLWIQNKETAEILQGKKKSCKDFQNKLWRH